MSISKERRAILWLSAALVLATFLPYLAGYFRTGPDWVYTGFVFGVEDGNSYIAKMLSGSAGAWLFRTPYTAYPQRGFLAFLPYILMGKLAAPPGAHAQLAALFHLYRALGGVLMLLASYDFAGVFIRQAGGRRLAAVLAVAGGGLGWLALLGVKDIWQQDLPLEFYSPESFGFLSLYGIPHLAAARALLLWGLVGYLRPQAGGFSLKDAVKSGLLWLGLGLLQPLTVVVGWAVLGAQLTVYAAVRWPAEKNLRAALQGEWLVQLKKALVIVLISSPLVVYTALSFMTDPFLREWGRQNLILSPPLLDYGMAYALLLPLAAFGAYRMARPASLKASLLFGWLLIFPLLAYAPYNLQRRLPEGIWAVICVLAVLGLERLPAGGRRWAGPALGLSFLPALALLLGGVLAVWQPSTPLFRPAQEVRAFEALAEYANPNDVVLADYARSNALAAWAPVRTLTGHGPESIRLKEVLPRVERFFSREANDRERQELIEEFAVRYVLSVSSTGDPQAASLAGAPYLTKIYDAGGYQIYTANEEE